MTKLLDTTVLVDYFRADLKAQRFLQHLEQIQISVITAAELLQGANNKKEKDAIKEFLSTVEIFPLTNPIGKIMLQLIENFASSNGLQIPDALIAATAITENLILVTENVKHFFFIPDLKIADWKDIEDKLTN